jgi:hypothetical protein
VRILLVGDSMTQESSGDWTWRYRLAEHLTKGGVPFDLVGPRTDLWEYVEAHDGSQAYVDPDFDRDHAARWGTHLETMGEEPPMGIGYTVGELVAEFHPDVVVEMLGVNDLAFGAKSPADLIGMLEDFVAEARAVDPGINVVLARIPQPWRADVQEFNSLLDDLAGDLDSAGSRVLMADTAADYSLADSYDSAHPNARGELRIAAAIEDALAILDIGQGAERPLPDVPLGPRIPPVLSATGGLYEAELSWVRSPGSHQSEVWARDATVGEHWHLVAEHQTGTGAVLAGLPGWHHVQVQTAPYKGTQRAAADAWSNVVDVEVLDDHLETPVASASATDAGVATVRWAAVPGATSYAIKWRRADQPETWLGVVTTGGLSAAVVGLENRVGYTFRVQAVRDELASEADTAAVVPALAPVKHARVIRTGHGVRTTADPVAAATSYTLRLATAKRCSRAPGEGRFRVVAAGLLRPSKRLRVNAPAVWVRWVAVRGGVEGDLASSSTRCVRLQR